MRDFDESTITKAVLDRLGGGTNSRLQEITRAAVRHLHDFVRETGLSEAEWKAGIDFLTAVGRMCDDKRQEFILLSDTLGISMLVDAINHRPGAGATETTVLGPFYVEAAPETDLGSDISNGMNGTPLWVEGSVSGRDGTPIEGAIIDVWHADADGYYDIQQPEQREEFAGRARFRSDSAGRFHFWTVHPAPYPIPADGPVGRMLEAQGRHPFRPAHVHFMIAAEGYRTLVTHVFVAGDPYLDSDVVFGVKDSLIREFERVPAEAAPNGRVVDGPFSRLRYDFHLQGRT